jgi:SAM-dependent methyltransferase
MGTSTLRFQFGKNWASFLSTVDEERITQAEGRLREALGDLTGKTILDIGCGSGIHSLAAVRLGASHVRSFDFDADSVRCCEELRRRFAPASNWQIDCGSALDESYLRSLGSFDVVYSWGVLHHTGDLWRALSLVSLPARDRLLISIYGDQGILSRIWKGLKRLYVGFPLLRPAIKGASLATIWGPKLLLQPHRVVSDWRNYQRKRGMSPWHDVVDWAGGYPFEFARPEAISQFMQRRGFILEATVLPRRAIIKINEFLFRRVTG